MTSEFAALAQAARGGAAFDDLQDAFNAIDFLSFSIKDIKEVEDAAWIPPEVKASKLRQWIRTQDAIISQIQGYLALRASVSKDEVKAVADAIGSPSTAGASFVVENIFEKLATGGGTRAFINPAEHGLITVEVDKMTNEPAPDADNGVYKAFDGNAATWYRSAAARDRWIKITLPPFLKVELTSYTLASKVPGLVSWVLRRSLDGKDTWEDVDSVSGSDAFHDADKQAVWPEPRKRAFPVAAKGYGRVFLLKQTDDSAQGNASIYLGSIEFAGRVLIEN
jgi:hypothetical protein